MATKLSNIIGAPFSEYVLRQLAIRAGRSSTGRGVGNVPPVRSNAEVLYLANKTAWARLVSSVDLDFPPDSKNTNTKYDGYIDDLGVAGSGTYPEPNSFAKNWILEAGTSIQNGNGITLRQGIGPNGAYGLGGTTELGYRPMPGLTSVNIETTGRLGSLRTATVNFKVWNINQLNAIEALYFRLGYSMLLEWGHTQYFKNYETDLKTKSEGGVFVPKDVYGIGDPFTKDLRKEKIQQLIEKKKVETSGNYDGMLGIVVNFNWSFSQDGGYDCMVRLVGLGAVIDTMRINQIYRLPEGVYRKYKQAAESIDADQQAQLNAQIKDLEKKEEGGEESSGAQLPPPPGAVGDLRKIMADYDSGPAGEPAFTSRYGFRSVQDYTDPSGNGNLADYYALFSTPTAGKKGAEFDGAKATFEGLYLNSRGAQRAFNYVKVTPSAPAIVKLDVGVLSGFVGKAKTFDYSSNLGVLASTEPVTDLYEYGNKVDKEDGYSPYNTSGLGKLFSVFSRHDKVVTVTNVVTYKATRVGIDQILPEPVSGLQTNTDTLRLFTASDVPLQGGGTKDIEITFKYSNPTYDKTYFKPTRRELIKAIETWDGTATITDISFTKNSGEIEVEGNFTVTVLSQYKPEPNETPPSYQSLVNFGTPGVIQDPKDPNRGVIPLPVVISFTANDTGFITGLKQPPSSAPAETKKEDAPSAASQEIARQQKAAAEQIQAAMAFESALHAMLTTVQTTAQADVLQTQDKSKIVSTLSITRDFYKSGILDGVLDVTETIPSDFDLKQYAAKGFSSELMVSSDPKATFPTIPYVGGSTEVANNKPNFKQLCQALVIKYKQESTSTVGITYAGDFKVYIPLGYLLAFINNSCLFYDSDNKDTTNNSQKRPYVYVDFNPETNFCLTSPQQFSIDPEICLVPANLDQAQYESIFPENIKPQTPFRTGTVNGKSDEAGDNAVSQVIDKSGLTFKSKDTPYRGKTMHILVCTQYLLGILRDFSTSDPQHAVALQPFLERVMVDINKCLGNMNLFRVAYRDDSNTVQIQDDQYVPLLSQEDSAILSRAYYTNLKENVLQSGEIPIFGTKIPGPNGNTIETNTLGIAREMQLKTAMSSKMASMLAISAQAATGSVNATDHSEISWLNRNFKDRYKPYVQDLGSNTGTDNNPSPDKNNTKGNTKGAATKTTATSPDQSAANIFNTHVKAVYGQYDLSKEQIQLAKNYYIERMSKVKAADLITSAAPFIPAEMEVTLDGISGIVMGNAFNIPESRLPYSYRQNGSPAVAFITNGLTHTIENNQWTTRIKGQMIKLREQSGLGKAVATPQGKQTEGKLYAAGGGGNVKPTNTSYEKGAYGYQGAGPLCQRDANGNVTSKPDGCYGGGQYQIDPSTPSYPNVSINKSNVTVYFPGLVYQKPNANSNINIANIPIPTIEDNTTQNRFKIGKFGGPPTAFIVHHTAGTGDPTSTFYRRGFPTQYWISADGVIHQLIPDGLKGQHMKNGDTEKGRGLSNSNTIGVEIVAPGCSEVNKAQKNAAIYLAYMLGFNRDQVFGHGEVNSHKQDCEGVAVSELIRKGQIAT